MVNGAGAGGTQMSGMGGVSPGMALGAVAVFGLLIGGVLFLTRRKGLNMYGSPSYLGYGTSAGSLYEDLDAGTSEQGNV